MHHIDMVTGADTQPSGSPIPNRTINAIGYNVKDNFIYGWDHTQETLVRVHDDHTAENLSITGYTHTSGHQIIIGDVDDNGHYWFINTSNNNWYQVDLNTSTPNLIASGSAAGPTGSAGADWAWVPGTNNLYRTMDNNPTDSVSLWAFNRTTKTWSDLGVLNTPGTSTSAITGSGRVIGANYADASGFLYASSNSPSGLIWRIDIGAVTATEFAQGPSSTSNDGARCASASLPIDFSDAPSGYSTLLVDDGPRHSVIGYNNSSKTGQLMLGKKVDIETDGFPSSGADGDDNNDIDDERGVTHIVATPGTPTALSIPVYVTNNGSQQATLAGWIDLDNDGTFETVERVTLTIPASTSGYFELSFPTTTFTANTYARFRIFEGAVSAPSPVGSATGGEVEDVLVQVGSYSVNKTADPAEGSTVGAGEIVTYTLNIQNTGSTALTNLKIDDDLSDVLDDATLEGAPTVNPPSAGTASVSDNVLEFAGDVGIGQTVTVTYAVKVKEAGSLGNNTLNNKVLAAHSANCHPEVANGAATVSHSDCSTAHVAALADTGANIWAILALAGGLIGSSVAILYFIRRQSAHASQQ